MQLYITLIIGLLIFILARLKRAQSKKGFTFGTFVYKNWTSVAINLLVGVLLIYSGYVYEKISDPTIQMLFTASTGISGSILLQYALDSANIKQIATTLLEKLTKKK